MQFFFLCALGFRLGYLGIQSASHYQTLADGNRIKLHILLPERGQILDRNGAVIASNEPKYNLVLLPGFRGKLEKILKETESLIGLDNNTVDELADEIRSKNQTSPFTIRQGLTWDEVCRIEVNASHLDGISVEKGLHRFYPTGSICAPVTGYVQIPGSEDEVDKSLLSLPDFRLGKAGLEKIYDLRLRGQAGYRELEVNAVRKVVRELAMQPGHPGEPLHLAIDLRLQRFITERLSEYESAAVVVMDVHTGEIHALTSYPSFDPNLFVDGIRSRDWKKLLTNPYGIMNNKTIAGQYPPGSTFKMVVGLAALATGKIKPDTKIHCNGHIEINGHRYHCMHNHGSVNLAEAIRGSCDVYFYEVARLAGVDNIHKMAHQLGLGQTTGIELPGEKKGIVPSRTWKLMRHRRSWNIGDTTLLGIGQGYMLATPLQLAVMIARLVNGGHAVTPTLIARKGSTERASRLEIPEERLHLIRDAMSQVTNHPGGTAWRARIETHGLEMGGKTGTAQVRRISRKERKNRVLKNEELPWQERDHSLFVGYAPLDNPRFAISVVVEHGGGGAKTAARIARDVLIYAQKLKEQP